MIVVIEFQDTELFGVAFFVSITISMVKRILEITYPIFIFLNQLLRKQLDYQ